MGSWGKSSISFTSKFLNSLRNITWKLFLYHWPCISILFSWSTVWNPVNNLKHSYYLISIQIFLWSIMIFIQDLSELCFFNWLGIKIILKTMRTYLEKNILNFSNKIVFRIRTLTNITNKSFGFWHNSSFIVLLWRKVNKSPVLKKSMNSHDRTDIAKQIFSTKCWGKIFFSIFPPHKNHWVSVVHIKVCIFDWKRKHFLIDFRSKVLREIFLLNLMNFVLFEPIGNGRKSNMRRRLDYCAWSQTTCVTNSFNVLTWHLYEISWC